MQFYFNVHMLPQRNMCSAYVVNSQSDKPSCFASFFSLSAGAKLINEFIYTHAGTGSIDNSSIPTPLFPDYFCRNMWINSFCLIGILVGVIIHFFVIF